MVGLTNDNLLFVMILQISGNQDIAEISAGFGDNTFFLLMQNQG